MRRHLDPLQLEQLHSEHQPTRTPIDWVAAVVTYFCWASFITSVCIAFAAYALGMLPGPTP